MGNVWASWLLDAARLTGYPVIEVSGWRTRGHGGFRVIEGVVAHHTADGPGEYPSLRVVRDGRAGLAGPLANLGLARSGAILVIAAGVGWHAGASRWAGFTDLNDEFIGIEAESAGTRDDWTHEQRDCYPRLCAALLYYMRRGTDRVAAHKEVCLPAGRKIDPAYWDMTALRTQVGSMLADPLNRIPRFANPGGPPMAVRDEVWQAPIPDLYKGGSHTLPAFSALAWSGTHAAHAKEAAERAAVAAERAATAAEQLLKLLSTDHPGPAELSDADVERVARAVLEKLVDRLNGE